MKLNRYNVLLADTEHPDSPEHATEHTITVLHGDQLRSELEAPRHGINDPAAMSMHFVTLWIWAALMRTHVIDQPFQEFLPRLLQFEDPDANSSEAAAGLDPTQRAAVTGSPSSSPTTSATSPDGSTPPPTTD